jgi:two-component system capsular synthesis response regulator RcsB
MIKKVLDYVYYCDDALSKLIDGKAHNHSYDLLISDLYFEEDYRKQRIVSGQALIVAARQIQPDLKILVFSAETRGSIVEMLFNTHHIDGYVRKARNDAKELKSAIGKIDKKERHLPWWYVDHLKHKNAYEFKSYDIAILSLLAKGIRQKDMTPHLKQKNIRASGKSSIEKRLKHIREALGFTNNEQLIAYCKDMGIV